MLRIGINSAAVGGVAHTTQINENDLAEIKGGTGLACDAWDWLTEDDEPEHCTEAITTTKTCADGTSETTTTTEPCS